MVRAVGGRRVSGEPLHKAGWRRGRNCLLVSRARPRAGEPVGTLLAGWEWAVLSRTHGGKERGPTLPGGSLFWD